MITIKTKEAASVWIGLLATAIAAGLLFAMEAKGVQVRWIAAVVVLLCTFTAVMLISLFIIRKYVAYKLKPIYSIVLSRNVHTDEIFTELKDKKGRHERSGDRPPEGGRALPQAVSGQCGARAENPDLQRAGLYLDPAGRRSGG